MVFIMDYASIIQNNNKNNNKEQLCRMDPNLWHGNKGCLHQIEQLIEQYSDIEGPYLVCYGITWTSTDQTE